MKRITERLNHEKQFVNESIKDSKNEAKRAKNRKKSRKSGNLTDDEYVAALGRAERNRQLKDNPHGRSAVRKVHKSKKSYSRKSKHQGRYD